jgi:DNA polymerase-3 subunit delta
LNEQVAVVLYDADHGDQLCIEDFVQNPPDARRLVLVQSDQSRVKKWFRQLSVDIEASVSKPKDYKIPEWIQNYGRGLGLEVSERLAEAMKNRMGTNLYVLHNELYKIRLYSGEGRVSPQDVAETLFHHSRVNKFDICETWGRHNNLKAVKECQAYRQRGGRPIPLIHVLLNHVEDLLLARALYDKGDRQGQAIQDQLNIPPFIWSNVYKPQVTARQQQAISDAQSNLLTVEHRMKSGRGSWPLIELFLFDH